MYYINDICTEVDVSIILLKQGTRWGYLVLVFGDERWCTMCKDNNVYTIDKNIISKEIAKYEKLGEYSIARGLLIAAKLAGINIASLRFYNKVDTEVKKSSK